MPDAGRRGEQVVANSEVSGNLTQIQIQYADKVFLEAETVAHSAYLEQVKRIAPAELHDRNNELAELAAFCEDPGQGQG
jgi:hypothetical protein